MKCKLLPTWLLFFSVYAQAQNADSSDHKLQVTAGLQFISNQTYAGRTNLLKLPVLSPECNIEFQKRIFYQYKKLSEFIGRHNNL